MRLSQRSCRELTIIHKTADSVIKTIACLADSLQSQALQLIDVQRCGARCEDRVYLFVAVG